MHSAESVVIRSVLRDPACCVSPSDVRSQERLRS